MDAARAVFWGNIIMEVSKGNIFKILNGYFQYQIPVYQRFYSWDIPHCERMWADIVAMQKAGDRVHFIGSIVNMAEVAMPTGIQKFLIIDGQQRMTTLSLLLIALRDYIQNNPDKNKINAQKLENTLLRNIYEEGDDQYKILLTASDRKVFIKLIEKDRIDENGASRVLKNYHFFYDRIASGELEPDEIYESIGKLQIVNITLEQGQDDPQAIFESLNSTGKALSESDLVRNFILMGLPGNQQTEIYRHRWHPMEMLFSDDKKGELMDRFFRDFLTMKEGRIPKINDVYATFKRWFASTKASTKEICDELYDYARIYTDIVFMRGNDSLVPLYREIHMLRMDVSYPFLMRVHNDFSKGIINESQLVEIIRMTIAYVCRRSVCDIPTNSLNKTFATLGREAMLDSRTDSRDYIDSIKAFYILQESYKKFPTDEQFAEAFVKRDIYHMRICSYILECLECYNNKSKINAADKTIEHIMPQNSNLCEEWRLALGEDWQEIQRTWLHTIGNLTLTNYNSEMSDKPFTEKMEMHGGFRESALRLNRFVIKQETWNDGLIRQRAGELANIAIRAWEYPVLSEDLLQRYSKVDSEQGKYNLDYYPFKPEDRILYDMLDRRIMNLSPDITRQCNKLYIAYKLDSNFVDVIVQRQGLRLSIVMPFDQINDPNGICVDQTGQGHWGNGDIRVDITPGMNIDWIMGLVEQAYRYHADEM